MGESSLNQKIRILSDIIPESEKVILESVKFENVLISYDLSKNFEVEFTVDNTVKGSSKDWIGIFRAGWNSFESFLNYENAIGFPCDETGRRRKVKFSTKYVQKAEPGVPYQFVYVNKYLEILGVSQYFKFLTNSFKKDIYLMQDSVNELTFSPKLESSPFKNCKSINVNGLDMRVNPNNEKFSERNVDDEKYPDGLIAPQQTKLHPNCNLYYLSKWRDTCTSCHQCKDLFQTIKSEDQLHQKKEMKSQEQNYALQNKLNHLETRLNGNKERNDLENRMLILSEALDNAIRTSVFGLSDRVKTSDNGCYDWDYSSKELYLKAVVGQQELVIRDLNKVICELGYTELPKFCSRPSIPLQDTVKKIRADERVIAEIYDVNNNTSDDE